MMGSLNLTQQQVADVTAYVNWSGQIAGEGEGECEGEGEGEDESGGKSGGKNTFDSSGNTTGFGIPGCLVGNTDAGQQTWAANCAMCHPIPYGVIEAKPYQDIKEALSEVPQMAPLSLTAQQIADVTAYLNMRSGDDD